MSQRNTTRNSILVVTKSDGSIITSALDNAQEFISFYTSLLGTKDQTRLVDDDVFEWGPMLSLELALDLCREITLAEVKLAVSFSLATTRSRRVLWHLNHTIIALVPKFEHSTSVVDYRPISCYNMIYKVITKIIANRISPALEHVLELAKQLSLGAETSHIISSWLRKWFDSTRGSRFHPVVPLTSTYVRLLTWSHGRFSPESSTECLQEFRDVSGLAVNTSKSSIFTASIQNDVLDGILARTEFARGNIGASLWYWQPKKDDSPLLRQLADIRDRVITPFGSSKAAVQRMAECSNNKGLETSKAYNDYIWSHIRQWLGITQRMSILLSAVKWLKKGKTGSSVQNKARHLALACMVYSLWRYRNEIIFEGKAPNPEVSNRFGRSFETWAEENANPEGGPAKHSGAQRVREVERREEDVQRVRKVSRMYVRRSLEGVQDFEGTLLESVKVWSPFSVLGYSLSAYSFSVNKGGLGLAAGAGVGGAQKLFG
ncbi:UNVERIFIED_CONTAM: hypothetical protein Scaly_2814200 [Sesamum calycinum]|uniref:Uncharacterized protein n=1 Tax=Sesamum calycinum TaxID=2727403 RepID=A0AAW2IUR2_9LAMI